MRPLHASATPFRPLSCSLALALLLAAAVAARAAETPSAPPAAPAADRALTAQIKAALEGKKAAFPARTLSKAQVADAKDKAWAAYKAAAVELGWDKTFGPMKHTLDEFMALPPEEQQKNRISPGLLPCDAENMPYFFVAKGQKPGKGWPLFFQMHGGGSTDEKLPGPHGWEVNTQDWYAQMQLFQVVLPQGMYFVPRMANDNKGRWWFKHNLTAFDKVIRCSILFRGADPDRIYMMGISEGAYGTEAITPFWADRLAGGCAMAGGAGGGERFYCLRNTAFRSDTGEKDTMFDRDKLAKKCHEYLDAMKQADPEGYDHMLNLQAGKGHGIDYRPGPEWIAAKVRNPRPAKVCWYNFALDGQRRTDFGWLALSQAPACDALVIASVDKGANAVAVEAMMNPDGQNEGAVYAAPPLQIKDRIPLTGGELVVYLDDALLDLDKPVKVTLNGKNAFQGRVTRSAAVVAETTAKYGDPGRVFSAKVTLKLPPAPSKPAAKPEAKPGAKPESKP